MKSLPTVAQLTLDVFRHWRSERSICGHPAQDDALARFAPYRRFAWCVVLALAACVLLAWPLEALADIHIFDDILRDAEDRQAQWFTRIQQLVRPTFMLLGALEICWAAAIWAFEKDNLNSFAVEVIRKIMAIGFFLVLLENAQDWIPRIFGTFEAVGLEATGLPVARLSTDGICNLGIQVAVALWRSVKTAASLVMAVPTQIMGTTIPGVASVHEIARAAVFLSVIAAAIIVISHVIVAAQFFCLKVESILLLATGAIFLAMGSSSWTREYVSKYLNYAINVGVRLLVMIFILSFTLGGLVKSPGDLPNLDPDPMINLIAASILQAILAIKAPELAGALLSGGSGLTAGSVVGTAGGALRGVAASASIAVNAAKALGNLAAAAKAGTVGKGGASALPSAPVGTGPQGARSHAPISGLGGVGSFGGSGPSGGGSQGARSSAVANGMGDGASRGQMSGPAGQGATERPAGLRSGPTEQATSSGTATAVEAAARPSQGARIPGQGDPSRASTPSGTSHAPPNATANSGATENRDARADASLSATTDNMPRMTEGNPDSTSAPVHEGGAQGSASIGGEQAVRPATESLTLSGSDRSLRSASSIPKMPSGAPSVGSSVTQAPPQIGPLRKGSTSTPSVSKSAPREGR